MSETQTKTDERTINDVNDRENVVYKTPAPKERTEEEVEEVKHMTYNQLEVKLDQEEADRPPMPLPLSR